MQLPSSIFHWNWFMANATAFAQLRMPELWHRLLEATQSYSWPMLATHNGMQRTLMLLSGRPMKSRLIAWSPVDHKSHNGTTITQKCETVREGLGRLGVTGSREMLRVSKIFCKDQKLWRSSYLCSTCQVWYRGEAHAERWRRISHPSVVLRTFRSVHHGCGCPMWDPP